jgi:RES domain-containing protein
MRLWRLTRRPFIRLDGSGAERYGGRWNRSGRPVVYTAAEASLAVLEVRVHLDLPFELLPDDYVLVEIECNDAAVEEGPALTATEECQDFGDRWLQEQRSALLSVPSAIVPCSRNLLINPRHAEASRAQVERLHEWNFDSRLF